MRRTVRHSREPRRVLCTPERQSDRYGWLHPARVNGISEEKARAMQAEALKIWRKRSPLAWTVRVDQTLLDGYPALAVLSGQRGVPGHGRDKVNLADRQAARVRLRS